MTEFENQLLQHLQKQAEQLTALSLSQSQNTQALAEMSKQQKGLCSQQETLTGLQTSLQQTMGQVLEALQKEPSSENLESTLKAALQPLQNNLGQLIESFNNLSNFCQQLSAQLPPLQKQ